MVVFFVRLVASALALIPLPASPLGAGRGRGRNQSWLQPSTLFATPSGEGLVTRGHRGIRDGGSLAALLQQDL